MSGGILARVAGAGDARGQRSSVRRVLALVGGRAQPDVLLRVRSDLALDLGHLHALVIAGVLHRIGEDEDLCLAASLIDYSAPTVGPVAESSYEACEFSLRRSQRAAMQFAGENPSRNYRSCASTIGPTRPRGQRRVDGGGRPKIRQTILVR